MKKFNFKSILPHLIAVIVFVVVASVYCRPAFEGKVIEQHDIMGWRGMVQQSFEYKEKTGHFPLWTNSLFSGMPAFQIAIEGRTHISLYFIHYIVTLGLPKPVSFFFLACIAFYFLCLVAGANPWLGILGGLSYAYSTFDPIIIAVGHETQMFSIAYAPAVLAGLLLLFKKRYWTGFAVTTVAGTLLLMQNHVQIVYYLLLIAVVMFLTFLVKCIKEKQTSVAIRSGVFAVVAGLIGLACNAVVLYPTYDYAKESMRGGRSELTIGDSTQKTKGGLDKDYAFRYSLGLPEVLTFAVPALYGGSNGGDEFKPDTKFTDQITSLGMSPEQAVQYENAYSYWGEQPGTSGPVYLGAIVCLLFIFGVVYVKGWMKWWLVLASLLGVILAYGANLSSVNFFLFDHLPFYNKFRAPTMALVIPQLCFPLLGVLALTKLVRNATSEETFKKLRLTGIIAAALVVILGLFYMTSSFEGPNDKALKQNFQQSLMQQVPPGQTPPPQVQQQAEQMSTGLINALQADRKSHMGGDLLRTIILMALAFGLLYLFTKKKISDKLLYSGLIILSGFDLLGIASRYLNTGKYVDENTFESAFLPTPADQQIMKDPDHANFRVFNETVDPFNDASTSYHHNSVGGYHPAKLGLYNDLITWQLSKMNMEVFDMLNTKYFIVPDQQTGRPVAQLNPGAFGNVWFVRGIKEVPGPNEEMLALDNTNLRDTAVIEAKFRSQIKTMPQPDSAATIKLIQNLNDTIDYSYSSSTPQVAVFSEIYYPRGWNVFVDGKPSEYFRTDYALRGMYLPAGNHKIQFRFEPASYFTGRAISIVSTLIAALIIIVAIILGMRQKRKLDSFALDDLK